MMRSAWGIFAAGVLVGAVAVVLLADMRNTGPAPGAAPLITQDGPGQTIQQASVVNDSVEGEGDAAPPSPALGKLRDEVTALTELRTELRTKTKELSTRLAAMQQDAPPCPQAGPDPAGFNRASGEEVQSPTPEKLAKLIEAAVPRFTTDRLHADQLGGASIAAVRDAFEDANREIAMLASAAYQQGLGNDPSLQEQRLLLRQSLQDYLGPDAYLAGLYATGQPNRLVVTGVAEGTDAASQGVQRGDVLLGVNGYRVFDDADFRAATGSLVAGSPVQVEVLRHGQSLRFLIDDPAMSLKVFAQRIDPDNYFAAE